MKFLFWVLIFNNIGECKNEAFLMGSDINTYTPKNNPCVTYLGAILVLRLKLYNVSERKNEAFLMGGNNNTSTSKKQSLRYIPASDSCFGY